MTIIEIEDSQNGYRHKIIQGKDVDPYLEDIIYETWEEAFDSLTHLFKDVLHRQHGIVTLGDIK
tara:strand:- start:1054 stop:1245 length:192 start_codon:yes stop_codon:yes gene_type:complete